MDLLEEAREQSAEENMFSVKEVTGGQTNSVAESAS
jgi:hypothetical protein